MGGQSEGNKSPNPDFQTFGIFVSFC